MAYIQIDITDPNDIAQTLTTYWFLRHVNMDFVSQTGEFHWFVYSGLSGSDPDLTTQVLAPLRVGMDAVGYTDPTSNTHTLSLQWAAVDTAMQAVAGAIVGFARMEKGIFDAAKPFTYRFNDENVDLSTGTEF